MKFKVGDMVRIRKDLVEETMYGTNIVDDAMIYYLGDASVVTDACLDAYKLAIDGGESYWTDEMFESDAVDTASAPNTRNVAGIGAMDVIRTMLTPEEYRGFLKGSVLKYQEKMVAHPETSNESYAKMKICLNLLQEEQR